jgi:hypothetical protein
VVFWPAGALDRPVVLDLDGDAHAIAIGPDGTLVGWLRDDSASTAAVWTPDGEQRLLPPPPGWDSSGASAVGREFAYGWAGRPRPASAPGARRSTPEGPFDGPAGPVIVGPPTEEDERVPVRWSLRTGKAQILRNLAGGVAAASPDGWLVVYAGPREGNTVAVLVSPTLQARTLPGSVRSVRWVGASGRTITGTVADASGGSHPVVWNCR